VITVDQLDSAVLAVFGLEAKSVSKGDHRVVSPMDKNYWNMKLVKLRRDRPIERRRLAQVGC